MIKYFCDICKKELKTGNKMKIFYDREEEHSNIIICRDCLDAIDGIVNPAKFYSKELLENAKDVQENAILREIDDIKKYMEMHKDEFKK